MIPVIMAGILGIYGLIVSVLISNRVQEATGPEEMQKGYSFLAAGLCTGFSALASGLAIGVAGEANVKAMAMTDSVYVGMILILIFAEAIGLYGLIIAIVLMQ